jgi:hypothetical protein
VKDIEVSDAVTFVRGITTSALTFTGQRFFLLSLRGFEEASKFVDPVQQI